MKRVVTFLIVPWFFWVASSNAQNLLENPNFDSDLAGWTEVPDTFGDCSWDPANLIGAGSGCANCLHDRVGGPSYFWLEQCVAVGHGDRLVVEAHSLFPCGQSGTGVANLRLFHKNQSSVTVRDTYCLKDGNDCAAWNRSLCPHVYIGSSTTSLCVMLEIYKDSVDDTFRAAFDGVRVMPVLIFRDDFEETADTSMWSATYP